mmetsp:Transcript_24756/g.68461  ORF Transcript_24756/g.68461 Transcript_24756/m.68461 type:complete len:322 (-) Transcript_24756:243-1208(-)|eukprot:CAMPEP_0168741558 /NCGR_PEP_ID=MMETSP0724-20121128/12579_1 /TAXON_ID=265536 /ORGANISM="Amphiprora sp., Strain CCMP467" /LENGTH=321 /DNA_ID=CAMNT_0008789073 /DNA_START=21 /DNA_END=986 /DNA_ORIENTATION=-
MITSFFKPKRGKRKSSSEPKPDANDATVVDHDDPALDEDPQYPSKKSKTAETTNEKGEEEAPTNGDAVDEMNADVASLVSSLHDGDWKNALMKKTFQTPAFERLAKFVTQERQQHTIYPPPRDTWSALNLCPLNDVKVVILGQDPYHGPGQAHGLCFSVLPRQAIPPSLKNMYLELMNDDRSQTKFTPTTRPSHGHLIRWAQQGVLLLNTVLSVRKGQPNSHQKKGWELVTGAILQCLQGRKCVFLLWGKPALQRVQALHATTSQASRKHHVVIATSHPSPLGARKTKAPFIGSQCFSRCNTALVQMGLDPIDWNVDGKLP